MTARAAQCGCGVHGFAMNPCEFVTTIATAPYYREARVTLARRQTACRMRHCCARRIVETGGRWELLLHFYKMGRAAADNRSKSNRIASAKRGICRAHGQCNRQASQLFELLACNGKTFLLGDQKGAILFCEREWPPLPRAAPAALLSPPRRSAPLKALGADQRPQGT